MAQRSCSIVLTDARFPIARRQLRLRLILAEASGVEEPKRSLRCKLRLIVELGLILAEASEVEELSGACAAS